MSGCRAPAPDLCPNVGQRIRQARQQRGLTQKALAKRMGCSYQLIQQYEQGKKLSLDRLTTLAATLRVAPDWLLTGMVAQHHQRPPMIGVEEIRQQPSGS
jgi:transcriptional regulator with XRE-family HTH domain